MAGPSGGTELAVAVGSASSDPSGLSAFGNRLVFAATDADGDRELWFSDDATTPQLAGNLNVSASSSPSNFTVIDAALYFVATGSNGAEVWRWDGSGVPGEVTALSNGFLLEYGLAGASGTVYFFESAGGGFEIFGSTGSTGAPAQTQLTFSNLFGSSLRLASVGDRVAANVGRELYLTDGAAAVTFDLTPGSSDPRFCGVANGLLFMDTGGSPVQLFVTDGSLVNAPVLLGYGTCDAFASFGGAVFFAAGAASFDERQLYKRQGATTTLVKHIALAPPSTDPYGFVAVGTTGFFFGLGNRALTVIGASGATDALSALNETIDYLTSLDGKVYAGGNDATTPGTFIYDPSVGAPGTFITDFVATADARSFDGKIYIVSSAGKLWDLNGTSATLHTLPLDAPEQLTVAGDKLYFILDSEGIGQLWQVAPGGVISQVGTVANASRLATDGSTLYFTQNTQQLQAIPAGGVPSLVYDAAANGCTLSTLHPALTRLFFPVDCPASGKELWVTKATAPGTFTLGDLWPGTASGFVGAVATLGDTFLFSAGSDATGAELWKSDGTAVGTVLVKDIFAGSNGSFPSLGAQAAGVVWFAASDGAHGYELWRSDGTAVGTVLSLDIEEGPSSSFPGLFYAGRGGLLFAATTLAEGREPWFAGPFANLSTQVVSSNPAPTIATAFTLTAMVSNGGPGAADAAQLTFDVPAGLALTGVAPSQGACEPLPAGGNVTFTCLFGTLAADAEASVVYTLEATAEGEHVSLFTASSATADLTADDLDVSLPVTASDPRAADLAVSASVLPLTVVVGEPATITATLVNNGPSTANNVVVQVVASGEFTVSSASVDATPCTLDGSTVTCSAGALPRAATKTATLVITPTAAGTVAATITATATETDAAPANNSASVSLVATASDSESGGTETKVDRPGCACRESSGPDAFLVLIACVLFLLRRRRAQRYLALKVRVRSS